MSTISTIKVDTKDALGVMNQIRNAITPFRPRILIGTIKGINRTYPLNYRSIKRLINRA